jgi:hypothetical protein
MKGDKGKEYSIFQTPGSSWLFFHLFPCHIHPSSWYGMMLTN